MGLENVPYKTETIALEPSSSAPASAGAASGPGDPALNLSCPSQTAQQAHMPPFQKRRIWRWQMKRYPHCGFCWVGFSWREAIITILSMLRPVATCVDHGSMKERPSDMINPFPGYAPATWRGMTGLNPEHPVAGIGLMSFDGVIHQFVLSDLDLWRMIEQAAETLPGQRARQLRTFFQRSSDAGNAAEAGSMPRGVDLQSPASSRSKTFSGDGA